MKVNVKLQNWYSNDPKLLFRHAIAGWAILLLSTIFFVFTSLILSAFVSEPNLLLSISFLIITPFIIAGHIHLSKNQYSLNIFSKQVNKKSFGIVPVNSKTSFNFASLIGDTTIPITLSVGASQVYNSLSITTVLAKAAINLAYGIWGKNLEEIIIKIGRENSNIEFQIHEQRFRMNIERLNMTAEIMSKVLREVEESPNFPSDLRDELKTRLYKVFYEEIESAAEKVYYSTQKTNLSWKKENLNELLNKRIEVTLLSQTKSENEEISLFSEPIKYLLSDSKKKKS